MGGVTRDVKEWTDFMEHRVSYGSIRSIEKMVKYCVAAGCSNTGNHGVSFF